MQARNESASTSMYATPMVTTGQEALAIPPGLKLATDPIGIPYPILHWGGYSYWPLSYIDNRVAMSIAVYDESAALVEQWSRDGARYIASISVGVTQQSVTFVGQASAKVVMTWRDLVVTPQVIQMDPSQAPQIPSGLKLTTNRDGVSYPVLKWGGYSYWPLSYIDNRTAMVIAAYDAEGALTHAWSQTGARYIDSIKVDTSARQVRFVGQAGQSFEMSWDTLCVAYSMCYQATANDLLAVAAEYGLPLTQADAAALAAALPMFSCANCGMTAQAASMQVAVRSPEGIWYAAVGSIVGGVVGAVVGAAIGGPPGAIAGFVFGSAVGIEIGQKVELTPPSYSYTPGSIEQQTFVHMQKFPTGPFANSSLHENLFDLPFLRYGQIDVAGALAPPGPGNAVQVYYPKLSQITGPNLTKYPPLVRSRGNIYKFIFVIVQVPNESKGGQPAFQLRMHPEDFYPGTINSKDRVNHSQLSEGCRFAALLGWDSMQVYAAGSLYVLDGKLIGIDSRTGHYYWGFQGKDQDVIHATLGFMRSLGYDTSVILQWADLFALLRDRV